MSQADHIEYVLAQWKRERPDLDTTPIGVIGRLHRLAKRLRTELVTVYTQYDLGEGEFDVLATLRRSGSPYGLSPAELAAQTVVTGGAVSKQVDRLERRGYVSRRDVASDGRRTTVTLTPTGKTVIDKAFTAHINNEHRLLDPLTAAERSELARLLGKLGVD